MPTDAPSVESSPTSTSAPTPALPNLATMTEADRDEWFLTGKVPEPKAPETPAPPPADSASAPSGEQTASTEVSPSAASEPATPKKKNAETRIQELLRERHERDSRIAELERRIAEQSRQPSPPDVSAASSPADDLSSFDAWQVTHPDGSYEDYLLAKFEAKQESQRTAEAKQAQQRAYDEARATRQREFGRRFAEALDSGVEFSPEVTALVPLDQLAPEATPTALNVAAQEIVESEHAIALMAHLSAHPEELTALSALRTSAAVIRAMAKLEAKLSAPSVPPVKTVSSAPPPPTTLGSRPAVPADPARAAVAARDFATYEREMNAREVARAR